MASNLRRSKRTFGQRFLRAEQRLDAGGRRPTPRRIGSRIVTSSNLAPGAITTVTLAPEVSTQIVYAQATADGKNSIYYQPSAPTGGTYADDDIWFDTDDDHKMYRYDTSSSTWVGFALGNNAIAELSADKLTAGTLDAEQVTVSNLDAGSVTTGTLSGVTISGNTITGNTITGGTLDIGSGTFEVDSSGNLTATSATITGSITGASSITIGSSDTVFKVDSSGNMWLGDAVYADAPFKVSNAGAVTATSATITGSITGASSITIGSSNTVFKVDSSGNMWLGNTAYASAPFKVSNAGALTATSATVTGTINATAGTFSGDISVTGNLIAPTLKLGTASPESNVQITLGTSYGSGISLYGAYGSIIVGNALGPAGGEGNVYYGLSEHNFSVSNSGGSTDTTMFLTNRDTVSYIDIQPLQSPAVYTNAQFQIRFDGISRLGANSSALYISRQSTTSGIGFADIGFGGVGTYSSRRELKENIKDVLPSESIERIKKLRPVDFTFKADAVKQELAPLNLRRGFIAEEMADVSHEMAEWSWIDKDDVYQLAGFPTPETDEDGNIIRGSQQIIEEDYPLESAVPAYWNHDAVIADCVNAIKYILSIIDS